MRWQATIKFAPLLTVERANDPAWQDGNREMVTPQTFRMLPGRTSIPLVADHDPGCELGLVRDWWRLRWIDGDWLAATAELHGPPPEFLQRGARASYSCKPLHRRALGFGTPEGQIIDDAILTEITVCATHVPIEPLAEVVSVNEVPNVQREPARSIEHYDADLDQPSWLIAAQLRAHTKGRLVRVTGTVLGVRE